MRFFILSLLLFSVGCGTFQPHPPSTEAGQAGAGLKMRHQILFRNGNDSQVFEGVMILFDDAYIVQAFAGPGIDLFTVARSGERHREVLHLEALADRIDVAKIGEDIACIYMEGCVPPHATPSGGTFTCIRGGKRLIETRDAEGRRVERRFPDAHGIGLTVQYSKYRLSAGRMMPETVELRWGDGTRSMRIQTVSSEVAAPGDRALITEFLQ